MKSHVVVIQVLWWLWVQPLHGLPDRAELQRLITCSARNFVDYTAVTPPEELPPCVDECDAGTDEVTGQCVAPTLSSAGLRLRFYTRQHCELQECPWLQSQADWDHHIAVMTMKLAQFLSVPLQELRVAVLSWEVDSWPPPPESPVLEYFYIAGGGELDFPGQRRLTATGSNLRWFVLNFAFRVDTARISLWDSRTRVLLEQNNQTFSSFLGTDVELRGSEVLATSAEPSEGSDEFAVVYKFQGMGENESPFDAADDTSGPVATTTLTAAGQGPVAPDIGMTSASWSSTTTSTSELQYECVVNDFGLGPASGYRRVAMSLQGCMDMCSITQACTAIEWQNPAHCFTATNYEGSLEELESGLAGVQLLGARGTWHACLRIGATTVTSSSSTSSSSASQRTTVVQGVGPPHWGVTTAAGSQDEITSIPTSTTMTTSLPNATFGEDMDLLREPETDGSSVPGWALGLLIGVLGICVACATLVLAMTHLALARETGAPSKVEPTVVGDEEAPSKPAGAASFAKGATFGGANSYTWKDDAKDTCAGRTASQQHSDSYWARPRRAASASAAIQRRPMFWPFSSRAEVPKDKPPEPEQSSQQGPRSAASECGSHGVPAEPTASNQRATGSTSGATFAKSFSAHATAPKPAQPCNAKGFSGGMTGTSSMPMPGRSRPERTTWGAASENPAAFSKEAKAGGVSKPAAATVPPDDAASPEAFASQLTQLKRSMSLGSRRKFFLAQCLKWHPDKNVGNESEATRMFQILQEKKAWFLRD